MIETSILSCEHIEIHAQPGQTDAFIRALQDYLRVLFSLSDELGSAELALTLDGETYEYVWMDDERPGAAGEQINALANAKEIGIRVNMCSELTDLASEQRKLNAMLRDGSLKDWVRYVELLADERTTSLTMSGIYRGAFLHGAVPFSGANEDILVSTQWNGLTHRAEFQLRKEERDSARELADALEQRFEIDLSISNDGGALLIEGLELKGLDDVRFYRETLETLVRKSEQNAITGALIPEDDRVFALLRFVPEGSSVFIQTAVAEA
ncbi:MAG: hypothetical protein IJ074_09220 [Clostridia bacterium]|nr:hypothetical protein [Clostridia bacterium]